MSELSFAPMDGARNSSRSMASATDAELVNACGSGDQDAFAHLYDRYSDRVFSFCLTLTRDRGLAEDAMADTFVTAWQRMNQLRDPNQVRPWLFAIAKNRVSRLGVKSSRQVAVDPSGTEMRSAFDLDQSAPETEVSDAMGGDAAVALVWEAAEGLNENERAVLELSVRQGVEGDELASALGVSRHNANVIASRMRQNLERSIGALFLLRYNDDGCVEFSNLVADCSGSLTPLWRKRISRHADACVVCSKKRAPKALALFGESPASAAPISARTQILASLPVTSDGLPKFDTSSFRAGRNGFPTGGGTLRRLLIGLGVAIVAIAVLTMTTIQVTGDSGGSSRPRVASSANSAAQVVDTTISPVVGSDGSTTIQTTQPSGAMTDTSANQGVAGTSSTANQTSTIQRDTTAPKITSVSLTSQSLVSSAIQCSSVGTRTSVLTVLATDDVGVVSGQATVEVSGGGGSLTLSGSGGTVKTTIGPFLSTGSFSIIQISVVDAAGNRSAVWPNPISGGITC